MEVGVGIGIKVGVGVGEGIGVSVGVGWRVGVGVAVGRRVGVGVGIGVRVGVGWRVCVGVAVGRRVGVGVGVGVGMGVGTGAIVGSGGCSVETVGSGVEVLNSEVASRGVGSVGVIVGARIDVDGVEFDPGPVVAGVMGERVSGGWGDKTTAVPVGALTKMLVLPGSELAQPTDSRMRDKKTTLNGDTCLALKGLL